MRTAVVVVVALLGALSGIGAIMRTPGKPGASNTAVGWAPVADSAGCAMGDSAVAG
jgi:hypothetical protein